MISRVLIFLLLLGFLSTAATAEPWCNQVIVSPNGEHYVVMKRVGNSFYEPWGPVYYKICKSGNDMPPMKAAKTRVMEFSINLAAPGGYRFGVNSDPNVAKRKGDRLIGFGVIMRPPGEILVSDEGLGFAGLDVFGPNYDLKDPKFEHAYACIVVSSSGTVLHAPSLTELYSKDELAAFKQDADMLLWRNETTPGWINHGKKQLVVVSSSVNENPKQYLIRMIDWNSGKITKGPVLESQDDIEALRREQLGESKP